MIRPRATVFSWLVEQSKLVASYDGSDQGFLNTVFSDWWQVLLLHIFTTTPTLPHLSTGFSDWWQVFTTAPARLLVYGALNY